MKKNLMIATGLLGAMAPVLLTDEAQAFGDLSAINANSRTLVSMNKIGQVTGVASNDTLNVRKGTDTSSSVLCSLKNNTQINIIAQDTVSGWYLINYDGTIGYVSNKYVTIVSDTVEIEDLPTISYSKYKVILVDINLRKEPSWSAEKVMVSKKGDLLNVVSISNGWASVYKDGEIVYAPANNVELVDNTLIVVPIPPTTPEPTPEPTPTPPTVEESKPSFTVTNFSMNGIVCNMASNDVLNIREIPDSESKLITSLKNNTQVTVTGITSNDWYRVDINGTVGYANKKYIKEYIPTVSTTKYKVITYDINLRTTPSWSASIDSTIKVNSIVDVISIDNGWASIYKDGKTLYVPSNYLEKVNATDTIIPPNIEDSPTEEIPPVSDEKPTEKTIIATVNTDDLNIRAGAGMSYSILSKVNKGDTVIVKNENPTNGWYNIELSNGITGWCYGPYLENFREGSLSTPPSNESTDSNIEQGQIATVNTNDLNVRAGAGMTYQVLGKVNKGDIVLIKSTTTVDGWYNVKLSSGIEGWCYKTYLENFRTGSLEISQEKPSLDNQESINKVIALAKAQIGKPYVYGAEGPNSFDCSGLSYYVFKNSVDITLPRNSSAQSTVGKYVAKADLQPGDLVFFNTSGKGISHLGIYIGNNEMIHAPSSGKNVQIVKITDTYWKNTYVTARRIIY